MFYIPIFLPVFLHSIKDFALCYNTENICPLSLTLTGLIIWSQVRKEFEIC